VRQFLTSLETVIAAQLEERSALVSETEAAELRAEYDEWRRARNADCAKRGRQDPDPLAELRCLATDSRRFYVDGELRLGELEAVQDEIRMRPEARRITSP